MDHKPALARVLSNNELRAARPGLRLLAVAVVLLASACQHEAAAQPEASVPALRQSSPVEAPPAVPTTDLPGQREDQAPTAPSRTTIAEIPVVLNAGMAAEVAPATQLLFERVVGDSRCKPNVQCVWAGEVTLALSLSSPTGRSEFQLSSRRETQRHVQSLSLELVSYGPCPGGPAITPLPGECARIAVKPRNDR